MLTQREKLYGGLIVGIVVFGFYFYAMAPSVSFWDCGEYLSCAYILGVPHPPGGPLHVLVRHVAMLIPTFKEIAARSNMLTVLVNTIAVVLIYLFILHTIANLREIRTKWEKIFVLGSAICGAFIAAFSYSFWHNAVESEAYGLATFVLILLIWFAILWEKTENWRWLLLIAWIASVTIGIHFMPLLSVPGIVLFYLVVRYDELKEIYKKNPILYAAVLTLIGLGIYLVFCAPIAAKIIKVPLKETLFGTPTLLLALLIMVAVTVWFETHSKKIMILTGFLLLFGFTVYLYLMIRAKFDPWVNECDPRNLKELWDMFTRKQYGPDVATRLLTRTTSEKTGYPWIVGYFWQIMFYLKYYSWQYVPWPRELVTLGEESHQVIKILSMIGTGVYSGLAVWGMYCNYKWNKRTFWLFFMAWFTASMLFVLYNNFKFSPSDPNPAHQPREVRERQYFFGPAFALWAYFVGIGIYGIIILIREKYRKYALPMFIFGIIPLISNFHSHANRHGNFVADEYGRNLLNCCEDISLIFTNGDNDTFPLWFSQCVKGTKPKVYVANLSLLNTSWFIRELKRRGAPVSFTDYEIENLEGAYPVIKDGKTQNKFLLVKDIMIRDIIATNTGKYFARKLLMPIKRSALPKEYQVYFDREIIFPQEYTKILPKKYWFRLPEEYLLPKGEFAPLVMKDYKGKIPIYFAVTVSEDNTKWYKDYLRMEALVQRVVPKKEAGFDIERTDSLLFKVFDYRSVLNPRVYKESTLQKLITNYAAVMWQLAVEYLKKKDYENALRVLKFAHKLKVKRVPLAYQIAMVYRELGEFDSMQKYLGEHKAKDATYWIMMGEFYLEVEHRNIEEAVKAFKKALEYEPKNGVAYAGLIHAYTMLGKSKEVNKLLEKITDDSRLTGKVVGYFLGTNQDSFAYIVLKNWYRKHPYDQNAKKILDSLSFKLRK